MQRRLVFLWVLSTNVVTNNVGMQQAFTRVGRAHRRRPALGQVILEDAADVLVIDSRPGAEHEAAEAQLDEVRFQRVLKLVALGIYRHHFEAPWLGEVRVHADFIAESDAELRPKSDAARLVLFEVTSTLLVSEPRYGENPEVFWHGVHQPQRDTSASCGWCFAAAVQQRHSSRGLANIQIIQLEPNARRLATARGSFGTLDRP
jgi:hypothetical protein